jgi:hypothetical protein
MSSYVNRILIDGETLMYQARLSVWSQFVVI